MTGNPGHQTSSLFLSWLTSEPDFACQPQDSIKFMVVFIDMWNPNFDVLGTNVSG